MIGTIEIVSVDLDTVGGHMRTALTTVAEQDRAAQYRHACDGRYFLARRAMLRAIIARHMGRPPASDDLTHDALGRPIAASGGPYVSQSSRATTMIVALSEDRAVGCDIEPWCCGIDMAAVAAQCFGPAERRALVVAAPDRYARIFYDIWTRKEAYLKAIGVGFGEDMASFETVSSEDAGHVAALSDWAWHSWHPSPNSSAAVVARGDWIVHHRKFEPSDAMFPA